jgi:hypothetical protein
MISLLGKRPAEKPLQKPEVVKEMKRLPIANYSDSDE